MRIRSVLPLVQAFLACAALPARAGEDPARLDARFGTLQLPAYIKHYEADPSGKVLLNPYLQVATPEHPGLLDPKRAPYNWVIDAEGRVVLIQEAPHPYGRTYAKGFFRPEDQSKRKPGTVENYGHVSALAGGPGRISGELNWDKGTKTFTINNKSGRYSKRNADRTLEQFAEAAKLIRRVVDPGSDAWGPAFYLLEYAPESAQAAYGASPDVAYDDPATKSRPHLVVLPPAPAAVRPGRPVPQGEPAPAFAAAPVKGEPAPSGAALPAKKAKKPKAANNDDPS